MNIRRRLWQAFPIVRTLVVGGSAFLLSAPAIHAQSTGSSSTSGGGSGSSMGGSGGSSSGGNTATSVSGASTNTLTNSSTLSNSQGIGTSGLGTTGAGGTTGTYRPGSTTGPSASNILAPYYVNPLQPGLPNTSSTSSTGGTATATKQFGQPLFVTANNNLASASRGGAAGGGGGGMGSGSLGTTTAASTMHLGPRYTQSLGWKANPTSSTRLQTELQALVTNSPRFTNAKGIQVVMDGQTVVLRGTAADEHERALATAMVGMSPGVYSVRNELKVAPPSATPAGSGVRQP